MKLKFLFSLFICLTACSTSIHMKKLVYGNQLKNIDISDIEFNTLKLDEIPGSYNENFDEFDFRDTLLSQVSVILEAPILKMLIITPKEVSKPYDAFAYLSNKSIVPLRFQNTGNFKQGMDIIFKSQHKNLEEDKKNGLFERQPELNQNPQFMLVIGKGQFSQKWVNSGMLIDERPYEKTGNYLYKNAPKQYNEAKIAAEKKKFINTYINTRGAHLDAENLKEEFKKYLAKHHLKPKPPVDNEAVYKEFESLAGYPFPVELKTLFKMHDGIDGTRFLNAQQVFTEWKNWKSIYDDPNWSLVDLKGNNETDSDKTLGIYTNPYWIPFISTGGGNFIAIDYAPGSKGTSGQIIAFGADADKIKWVAGSLGDFLKL